MVPALILGLSGCSPPPEGQDWLPGPGLKTRWAAEVDPARPLPEHPRPQMVRPGWTSLNGMWDLAVGPDSDVPPERFQRRILVPFPVESALSGVAQAVSPRERVWYRRTFALPPEHEGPRWLLHFGAVDWEAEVFLNGRALGVHRGGYDPFTFEITGALIPERWQELVVGVRDPTDAGGQPRGKQVLDPHGIWYTAVTGIWQTVWLEAVPRHYVRSLRMDPDLAAGTLTLTVEVDETTAGVGFPGADPGAVTSGPGLEDRSRFLAVVTAAGRETARGSGSAGLPLALSIPDPRPWSPESPFLYDLRVELEGGDVVESYFGMRSVGVGRDAGGHLRLLLNGEPLFQYGLLDQGWWPDGLYTAPTDDALRFDITSSRTLGFNLIRKHVKAEPARWYHHADREGILVWQDMPSAGTGTKEDQEQFAGELEALVGALRNHPSIIMWVPFNEGWGQHDTERYVARLKDLDPTRLVNNASGWTDRGVGDVLDIHRYPGPGAPDPSAAGGRVAVLGEFGGLGLPLPGHTWVEEENWGYRSFDTREDLNQAYADLIFQLRPLVGEGLSAAVYTQTTDVEIEVNGILTYDREVLKLSEASVDLHQALFGPPPTLREVVPTSRETGQIWRYTEAGPGRAWFEPDFDDTAWAQGLAGFGTSGTPGARVGTAWESPELWLRRSFHLSRDALSRIQDGRLFLRIHHDEDAEIYLNGVQVAVLQGYTAEYRLHSLDPEEVALLREGGNTLGVHVRQTTGGQFVDVGIVEWVEGGGG
jgi:hypothetical protein